MTQALLLAHVAFGIVCILTALWLFVDTLQANAGNLARIRVMSRFSAAAMWIAFLAGGYWYVTFYKSDKAIILNGPWRFSHSMVMETKEHLVIMLLLLATFLPIAAADDLINSKAARHLTLWIAAMVVILGLVMDGEGGIIAMGVKVGLLPH